MGGRGWGQDGEPLERGGKERVESVNSKVFLRIS